MGASEMHFETFCFGGAQSHSRITIKKYKHIVERLTTKWRLTSIV